MQNHRSAILLRKFFMAALMATMLSACLMGEEEAETDGEVESDVNVTGSIGDGPIVAANVTIFLNNSSVLTEFVSGDDATYDVDIRTKGKYYPLVIEARDGVDLVTNMAPDFTMKGSLLEPGKKSIANVNPFSTFAYELARDLDGGISKSNLELAQSTVVSTLNCGLSSLVGSGPMSTTIDSGNVAEIVRASEALGETVRRTRDTLLMFNYPGTGDGVVGALASDLTDSLIDGRGGSRADSRTAAIATIVSTLVQLETISNELHVYGVDATGAMNSSIQQISSSTPSIMVDDLLATSDMLTSIRTGMVAAAQVSTDAKVAELQQAVNGLQSGMDYTLVRTLLPDDYRTTLQNVLLTVGGGDETIVDAVNSSVRGGDSNSVNTPPVISGSPPSEVNANTVFDFIPSATDADPGDSLTFTISGRPSWANFNSTTGRLSGTPSDGDVGVFSNITIAVSDGTDTASIGPFAITVQGSSVGSVTLSWAAPTENEDGTPLTDLDGYRLYWGTTPGSYPNTVTIDNPSVTTYLVDNLAPGTYEFVATSFNTTGVESDYSSPIVKTVP